MTIGNVTIEKDFTGFEDWGVASYTIVQRSDDEIHGMYIGFSWKCNLGFKYVPRRIYGQHRLYLGFMYIWWGMNW